jgi:hypothetical protein
LKTKNEDVMKLRHILLFLLPFVYSVANAQEAPPTASPEIKGFSLSPDNVGAIANTVNLYTGDLSLPLSLISIPGRNGLDVGVSIMYNSGVQNQVDTWNLEAPTGILGLGWGMDIPKIIADTKQTGTREDDTYYLAEGGSSNRLIRTVSGSDATGPYYVYETKNYQFWKIKYYYDNIEMIGSTAWGTGPNKWEITKENGMKYIYGDKNSGRGTIQYSVRWDNWIGNSAQPLGQSQLANAWNLSEIINLMGEKIIFEYTNVEQFVGSGAGQKHTEASYLKQITDVIGRKVQFFYNEKQAQFYAEPHTEQAEPDAYQETYEKKYLDHIDVLQEAGTKQMSVHFKYSAINSGANTAKMLLGYIEQRNSANQAQPGIQFDYYQTTGTNGHKGFLQKVTYPTQGSVSYNYKLSGNMLDRSFRNFTVLAPPGYAEPKLWIGNDYVVATWRSLGVGGSHDTGPQTVRLSVYQWVGEWKEQFLQTISGIKSYDNNINIEYYADYQDFKVVLEDGFFGVISGGVGTNYDLWLYSKNESIRGNWLGRPSQSIDCGPCSGTASWPCANSQPTLTSGSNFIALGTYQDDSTRPSHLFIFQGNSWQDVILNQTGGDHFYTAGPNYFFSHNRVGTSGLAEMNFSYLTEDKKWITKNWLNSLTFGGPNRSYWYGSNSFLVAMANNNPEFIYRWDLTHANFFRDDNVLGAWADHSYVFNINNSQVGIVEKAVPSRGKTARFDGKYWYPSSDIQANWPYSFTYGEDFALWTYGNNGTIIYGYQRTFNPNTLNWFDQDLFYTPNGTLYGSPTETGVNPLEAGPGYFVYSDKVYFRKANGLWLPDYTFTVPAGVTMYSNSLKVGSDKYFIFKRSDGTYLQFIKNGGIGNVITSITGKYEHFVEDWINLISPNTIVTYSSSQISDATSLNLFRVLNGDALGSQLDYPVSLITVNDGIKDTYTSFDYNFATAVIDPSGSVAQYNQVTVIPGSNTSTNKPLGYTTTYFHNGLTASDVGATGADYFNTDLRWAGSPYRTKVFDKNNAEVSVSNSTMSSTNKDFFNSDGTKVDAGFYARPFQITSTFDNITTVNQQTFDANTGQLKTQHVGNTGDMGVGGVGITDEYTYWWEKYDPARSKNILVGAIQTSRKVNGVYTESQVSRYKNWNAGLISSTVPGPYDSYVWKGSGTLPDAFTAWDVATVPTPPANWQYSGKVISKDDNTGAVYESSAKGDIVSATIYDQYKIRPLAVVGNASFNQVAFAGFEDNSQGNWSWSDGVVTTGSSKTGTRYISLGNLGITKSGLTATQNYTVSFWAKSVSGSVIIDGVGTVLINAPSTWTYFEYTVTGLTSFNLKKSGTIEVQIDELRLHPARALMKTFTYHPLYGVASETNSNNETSYTEYDEWGRVKNILDENRNIIKTNTYYTKK